MKKKRIAITGLGTVSPLGTDVLSSWTHLLRGTSAIHPITQFDASSFPTAMAAEVKNFQPRASLINKHSRFALPFAHYAMEALHQTLEDAGIKPQKHNAHRWGIIAGSGMMTAEYSYQQRFQAACAKEGIPDWEELQNAASSFYQLSDFGKTVSNATLSMLLQQFGIEGYATSVHTACASSGQALGLALQVLRRGEADYIVAGGFDSMITPLGLSSFCLLGALSSHTENPSRPFDKTRNGFILGEGAAFLLLEDWDLAVRRKAPIYAELASEGNSLSAYRITDSHPNGDGAIQAIQQALRQANVASSDVDYINAHGTSTKMNDLSETNAIKAVFQERAKKIPVSSTKGQTGHLIAAAGALEALFTVLSIKHSQIPKTAHLSTPDPDCDLDYVVDGPREKSIGIALSNSFGFGGSNSCLLFKHPEVGEHA
jgi:3-oxoacyl-(acyl-carrier-protein) synthase